MAPPFYGRIVEGHEHGDKRSSFAQANECARDLGQPTAGSFHTMLLRNAIEIAATVNIPVAITIAGGYGRNIADSVAVHVNTVRIAAGVGRD